MVNHYRPYGNHLLHPARAHAGNRALYGQQEMSGSLLYRMHFHDDSGTEDKRWRYYMASFIFHSWMDGHLASSIGDVQYADADDAPDKHGKVS